MSERIEKSEPIKEPPFGTAGWSLPASEAAADKPEARVAATGVDDYWRNKIADTEQVFMALMDSVGDVTVDVTATGQKALDAFLEAEAKAWKFLYGSRPNPRTATPNKESE